MPSKQCRVSVTDSSGIEHTVTVEADSVYLAAARGLAELRRHGWVDEIPEGLDCLRIVVSESREVSIASQSNVCSNGRRGARGAQRRCCGGRRCGGSWGVE